MTEGISATTAGGSTRQASTTAIAQMGGGRSARPTRPAMAVARETMGLDSQERRRYDEKGNR